MSRTERFFKIQRLLEQGRVVSTQQFLEQLEVSRPTFRRDLDYLRDRLGVPIVWNAGEGGYTLEEQAGNEARHNMPGLWLSEKEIFGLLTVIQLLSGLEPETLIGDQIKPLRERLEKLLEQDRFSAKEIHSRIRLMALGKRQYASDHFQVVAHALMTRKRLFIRHFGRFDATVTEREVSPQRIIYYRDNWYMDGFCHLRNDMRSFSIDALEMAAEVDKPAVSVDDKVLRDDFESSYGIFAGKKSFTAKLKFTPFRARWVAKETWHPDQKGTLLEDGSYLLEVPYADDRELLHDILRQGKDVEVLGPPALRKKLQAELREMLRNSVDDM